MARNRGGVSMRKSDIVRHPEGLSGAAPELPVWDLSDLYAGTSDPRIEADLVRGEGEAKKFALGLQGRLAGLSGEGLAQAVRDYERIEESLGRVMSYAQLLFS